MLRTTRGFCGGVTALSAAFLAFSIPALASLPPAPGVINYVEGQVLVNGEPVTVKNVGTIQLGQKQVLTTDVGKAEVLLGPGIVARVGYHSELRMVSADLSDTRIELARGEAMVEVIETHPSESLRILNHGASVRLEKNGLYGFNADTLRVSVFEGSAVVVAGDKSVTLGKGRQTFLATDTLRSVHFGRNTDELYMWGLARDGNLAKACNNWLSYHGATPGNWNGPGWYWNPDFGFYSFVPGKSLNNPSGFGFYSPFNNFYHYFPG